MVDGVPCAGMGLKDLVSQTQAPQPQVGAELHCQGWALPQHAQRQHFMCLWQDEMQKEMETTPEISKFLVEVEPWKLNRLQ